jgi:hypothetical protein
MSQYEMRTCGKCRGVGVVQSPNTFEIDPTDCDCSGGTIVVYRNGAVAAYPGGPFVDCWPASQAVGR